MRSIALLVAATALLSGCFEQSPQLTGEAVPRPALPNSAMPATGAQVELGRRIYNFRCYYCHGYSGDARTLAATLLTPKPADFTGISPDALGRILSCEKDNVINQIESYPEQAKLKRILQIAAVADF